MSEVRLIDANALKNEFIKEFYTALGKSGNSFDVIGTMTKIIDNAPTIKFSLLPADESKDEAYMRGYEKGKIEGILKANTRPKCDCEVCKALRVSYLHQDSITKSDTQI